MLKKTILNKNSRLDTDARQLTQARVQLIRKKKFLMKIYEEWYRLIVDNLPDISGPVLELGSGAGFLTDHLPNLITSEVFYCSNVRSVFDGRLLPFAPNSLKAIVMTDVFHHIPDASSFIEESRRCLVPGGKIVMIEPWVSIWSRWVYSNLHHEPFSPESIQWEFPSTGPLSSANGALPWIVFQRDQKIFSAAFPDLKIQVLRPFMPIRYLISGGLTWPSFNPGWSFNCWKSIEELANPWMHKIAMFALIVIKYR